MDTDLELGAQKRDLYHSSKIGMEILLIPEIFFAAYQEELVLVAASAEPEPMGMVAMDGGGSGIAVDISAVTNGLVELNLLFSGDCGLYAEIFQKQNMIYPQLWNVVVNKMAVTGGVETVWVDPASSNATTMFYIVGDISAGFDDGDGYSELRERHVEDSNPFVFDMRDTDGDGMHDWHEIMNFGGSITNQSGTDDFDGDGLQNDVEMVLHPEEGTNSAYVTFSSDPSLFDTDGDGTDDGTEVAQGGDPADPADGGQPPEPPATTPVTLFVQDRSDAYLEGGYTMKLSDGNNTYEISSSGREVVSNTFDVVSGRSYTLTLVSHDFLPYTGAYTATVSGNGLVIKDPENILGVHDDNDTEVDLYDSGITATLHVIKVKISPVAMLVEESRDSGTFTCTVTPAGLSPTYQWLTGSANGAWPSTAGNNPQLEYSEPAGSSTEVEDTRWFAPTPSRRQVDDGITSKYTINCKVTIGGVDVVAQSASALNVRVDMEGGCIPPMFAGQESIEIEYDAPLWRVTGQGNFHRAPPLPHVDMPSTSQFYAKAMVHENKHATQYTSEAQWKDLYDADALYTSTLSGLGTIISSNDLRRMIQTEVGRL